MPIAKQYRFIILAYCFLFPVCNAPAQNNIPLGSWRLHLSYNNIQHVEVTSEQVFAASGSGILVYAPDDQSLNTYNKLNGLSSTGISGMKYDAVNNLLLVGYADGDLDIVTGNTVINFNRLKDAEVTTSKKINHISIRGNMAYLSTAYGMVTFDLLQLEIKETWRDLGVSGVGLSVFQSTFLNDSIFIASAEGVLVGNLNDNLLDFNNWTRFSTENFSGAIVAITTFNNKVFAAGPAGLFRFGGSGWLKEPFPETAAIQSLTASEANLFMISDSTIWHVDISGERSEISDPAIVAPLVVKQDNDGNFWIGDQSGGLISNSSGAFSAYLPDGPSLSAAHRLVYDKERIFVLPGGFTPAGQPLNRPGHVNVFEHGSWSAVVHPVSDITDLLLRDDQTFISTFGSGILVADAAGNNTFLDETNSPLLHTASGESRVAALANSANGLWVANYGGSEPLHVLKDDGAWESFPLNYPNGQHPTDLLFAGGLLWIVLNPETGGGLIVFDPTRNESFYQTAVAGGGGLPDASVYSVASDRNGFTWVGTGAGVAYFLTPLQDAVKPIYENRFLLRDEKIRALAVDAGNRKWIGTEQGVWLFGPTGEELVHHFTTENSPLLSNIIQDIVIHPATGEVFFATDEGIVSYRSDAIAAMPVFEKQITIFPNPVSPGYSGTVGISGLAEDAFVRITDISGKLVWQTQANGGMATWNLRDHRGRRAATGIYLVFASAVDGSQSMVGKLAVIE